MHAERFILDETHPSIAEEITASRESVLALPGFTIDVQMRMETTFPLHIVECETTWSFRVLLEA